MIQFGAGLAGGIVLSLAGLWLAVLASRVRIGSSSVEQFKVWRETMKRPVAKPEVQP